MTPFEEAVAQGGPLVAAWDYEDNESTRLVLFKVGSSGWTKLADTDVPAEAHEPTTERLTDRGVRVGATYAGSGFVWVADERGFGVWSDKAQTGSGKVASPAVSEVNVFYEGGKPDRRGVQLKLKSGGTEVVADDRSLAPSLDITYDQVNLEEETRWAHYMGLHLAIWHLVPLVNDISPFAIDDHLTIARAARALAKEVTTLPDIGTFDELTQTLGPLARSSNMVLCVTPTSEPATRAVEIRVTSPTGKLTESATIKRGSNAQVAAFLRRVTMPSAAMRAMNAIVNKQKREGA